MPKCLRPLVLLSFVLLVGCGKPKTTAATSPDGKTAVAQAGKNSSGERAAPPGGGFGGGITIGNENEPVRPGRGGFGTGGFGEPGELNYDKDRKPGNDDSGPTEPEPENPRTKPGAKRAFPTTVPEGPKQITVKTLTYRAGQNQKLFNVVVEGKPTAPQISYQWETGDGKPLTKDNTDRTICVFLIPESGGEPIRWQFNANGFTGQTRGTVGSSTIGDTPPFGKYKAHAFMCRNFERWDEITVLSNIVSFSYERSR